MQTLIAQPGKALTRKQFWATMTGGVIVLSAWIAGLAGFDIPPGIEGTAVAMASAWVGYMVRDRAQVRPLP